MSDRSAATSTFDASEANAATTGRAHAPRPLPAYLAASSAIAQQAIILCAEADDPRFPWRDSLRDDGRALAQAQKTLSAERFRRAVASEALAALSAMMNGVDAYRGAPPATPPTEPNVIWTAGSARLLDYFALSSASASPAVLVLPSLINRARILDLTEERSLMRGLARRGMRPFLLDWGVPGMAETRFDLEDYVVDRVLPALAAARRAAVKPVAVMGHCMSGPMALAAAQLRPDDVSRAVVMGAPWRFGAYFSDASERPPRDVLEQLIANAGAVFGGLPRDVLDTLFFLRNPLQTLRKFPRFAKADPASERARLFVAVEDWLNDGVLLVEKAARTLFVDWALDDALATGGWSVAGEPISPSRLRAPLLVIASKADTLVPYASATSLFADAPLAKLLNPTSGHVGMIVGRRAEAELWDPLARWLRD